MSVTHMRIALVLFIAVGALDYASLGQGTLSSVDDARYGANTLTVDTGTGLAWLDLPISRGLSYEQARAATQPGGALAGFRFASTNEVLGLFANAGVPRQGFFAISDPRTAPIISLLSLLGATSSQDGYPETFGITGTAGYSGSHYAGGLDFALYNAVPGYFVVGVSGFPSFGSFGDSFGADTWGNWLVTEVPEPSNWHFGIMAALMLVGWRFSYAGQDSLK